MNAHTWYRITGIARMIPTTIAILTLMKNASPSPVYWSWLLGSGATRMPMIGVAK